MDLWIAFMQRVVSRDAIPLAASDSDRPAIRDDARGRRIE
jgi:hypothetical protein